jgi:hypothetical protein
VGTLTVIYWRDIPAQVVARAGGETARAELPQRFANAIDAAAMTAGLVDSDAYLEQWRQEARPCGDDAAAEAAAELERLERAHDRSVLLALTRAGGVASA